MAITLNGLGTLRQKQKRFAARHPSVTEELVPGPEHQYKQRPRC